MEQPLTIPQLLKLIEATKDKPIVICGTCGAIEIHISETETVCPNCD